MCGIAGFLRWDGFDADAEIQLKHMTDAIAYRGPDSEGAWLDNQAGIALGHRRLAIVDLSPTGAQPMLSSCGRWVIAFNGEIYNYKEIKAELEANGWSTGWRGSSDTEVFLAAIAAFGITKAVERCVGMFAFALWDRKEKSLTLARDRLGEKPLYYAWLGDQFVFASDLAALYQHKNWIGTINRNAITLLMRHNYIPAPYSIFEGVSKLDPAHIHILSAHSQEPIIHCYWNSAVIIQKAHANPFSGSPDEAVDALETYLRQAITGQMIADVPLGAFLSGGIDSSTIVAVMQSLSKLPIRTFTIGFNEDGYNEAVHAKAVAKHLGTQHTELYVSPEDALGVIPHLPKIYSEPFSDSSQIPTYLVSQLARQHVTVSLSGDGGDELFSGYSRYALADQLYGKLSFVPKIARKSLAQILTALSPEKWDAALNAPLKLAPCKYHMKNIGDKLHKLAGVLGLENEEALYWRLISHWQNPNQLVLGGTEPPTALNGLRKLPDIKNFIQKMMYLDLISYLPDDILAKVDRAAMAVALESRVPLLDHRIVEFSASLPLSFMRREKQSKWPLRQILYRHVPKTLIERPKMGFGVPIDAWLRGPLREWAGDLLNSSRLKQEGYFNSDLVQTAWQEHQSGTRNQQYLLWDVLMFQAWSEQYKDKIRPQS